jgi:hypothetical protein
MDDRVVQIIKKKNSLDYMENEINDLLKKYDILSKACPSNLRMMKILEKSLKETSTYSWALSLISKYYCGIDRENLPRIMLSTNLMRVAYHVALGNIYSRRINELRLRISESFMDSAVDLLVPLFDRTELCGQIDKIKEVITIHNAFLRQQFYHPQIWTMDDWKGHVENNPEVNIMFWASGLIMSERFIKKHDLFKEPFFKLAESHYARLELASWKEYLINNKPSLFRSYILTKYQNQANIYDIEKSIYRSDELLFLINIIDANMAEFNTFIKKYFKKEYNTVTIKNITHQHNRVVKYSQLRRRELM